MLFISILTNTLSDVDILFTKCLRFAPQSGERDRRTCLLKCILIPMTAYHHSFSNVIHKS